MTTYVGVDLAWSAKNRTGMAAIDEAGKLLGMGEVVTDDEIVGWLEPYVADGTLVAIDAPLIVTNPEGQRPCERDLSAIFHSFHAGTHPTNLRKPEFSGGSRAMALCQRAGLDVDPRSTAFSRAIEVYPHPATITLFGLDSIIPYKHKPGRNFVDLQDGLLELIDQLQGLSNDVPSLVLDGSKAWAETVAAVRTATQKSHLRKVEDLVDAVLCAYVGLLHDQAPERTRIIGDLETGYIVVPIDERVRDKVDALQTVHTSRELTAGVAPGAPLLVPLNDVTALVIGEGSLGDLEVLEPPLLNGVDMESIAAAVSLGLGGLNVAAQAATALPAVRGLVRLAPDTMRQLATNTPITSGGWNLGALHGASGQITHQIRWAPAGSARAASVVAQLGPAAALLGIQLQLNQIAKSVEEGIAVTREVQRTLDLEHRSEVSASYETVMKAFREAVHVRSVTAHIWENISGHESALRKQRTHELDVVTSLTRELGAQSSAKSRRSWVVDHATSLIGHLNSLREAQQAWFTYQGLRAHHVRQTGDKTGLVEHIVATATREYDETQAQLRGISAQLTRLIGLLSDMPASKLDKLKGLGSGKSIEQALLVLQRLTRAVELLPTSEVEPLTVPKPPIQVVRDAEDAEVALRMSRWHLAPGEHVLAIAQGSQTTFNSWLLATESRAYVMKQNDLFDGDSPEWVAQGDIRYVRKRRSKLNKLYPLELTIVTKDRDISCSFGKWVHGEDASQEMDRLTRLLQSMMTLPADEIPVSPLLGEAEGNPPSITAGHDLV